jgi:hypothetical protein
MRIAFVCTALTAVAALSGCAETTSQQVAAAPPTVSYRVAGSNLAQANADAGRYCAQYGMAARLNGVQPDGTNAVASYSCVAGSSGAVYGSADYVPYAAATYPPAPVYGPPPTYNPPIYGSAVQCADALHQNRPGGSDYDGPPVPGCP